MDAILFIGDNSLFSKCGADIRKHIDDQHLMIPFYRAKHCRAKFLSLNKKIVTFVRRKSLPNSMIVLIIQIPSFLVHLWDSRRRTPQNSNCPFLLLLCFTKYYYLSVIRIFTSKFRIIETLYEWNISVIGT